MAQNFSPFSSKLFSINKKFISVDKLIGDKNKFKISESKKQRRFWEQKEFEEREKKLEGDKGTTEEKNTVNKFKLGSFGFLDVIKNFLFKTLFGYFVVKLLPQVPKLKGLLMTTLRVSDFIIGMAGSILNAFATFIDSGYKAVDFARGQMKLLGGDRGLAILDKALNLSTTMLNSMFIAGMLFSDLVESDSRGSAAQTTVDAVKKRVVEQGAKQAAQQAAIQNTSRIGVAGSAAIVAGVGLLASALGEGAFQLRKFSQKVEKDAYVGLANAQKDRNPFTRFLKVGFYQAFAIPGLRLYNFVSTGIGSLLDIIGAPFRYAIELINFGIMKVNGDESGLKKQRENLGKLDARIREQLRQIVNVLSFGTLAKDKGSFGSLFGNEAVKSMGYASGGEVTRGGGVSGSVRRGFERAKATRQIKVSTPPLQPGIDVGGTAPYGDDKEGLSKIEAFFPNPENPGSMNPYQYLKRSYEIVDSTPFLSPVLGMAVKILMGDKPSESDYGAVGTSLNSYFGSILDSTNVPGKKSSLTDEIGNIDISKWVKKSVQNSISNAASSILSDLAEQFKLKRTEGTGQSASPSAQKGDGASDNPLSGYGGEASFVIGDSIAHGFAGRGGNGGDADDSKVGRSAAKVLEILKARGDKLKGALIDLSTGIANSLSDFASVETQLSYLKSIGARVRVLGVGNQWSSRNGNVNQKLEQIVKKYGFYFYGGFDASGDKELGVHGDSKAYKQLKDKREGEVSSAASISAIPTGNINDLISGAKGFMQVGFPLRGAAYLAGNVQTESGWRGQRTPWVLNDGAGTNKGLISWNRSRITNAEKFLGKPLEKASNAEQIKWIKEELRQYGLLDDFMNPQATDQQLKSASYKYIGWGDLGDRWVYTQQALKALSTPKAFHGGYIDKTQKVLTHPGEYVIDADSVQSFGIEFYDIINQVETMSQRRDAAMMLTNILSQYTEDGYPETEDDYTYYIPEKSVAVLPSQPIPVRSFSFGGGVSEEDPSKDYLYS
jgi:hypothetical protein